MKTSTKIFWIGIPVSLAVGCLLWKFVFPQIPSLQAIGLFGLGSVSLWAALSCALKLVRQDSTPIGRWGYTAIFLGLFLNQLAQAFFSFANASFVNMMLLFALLVVQRLEEYQQNH